MFAIADLMTSCGQGDQVEPLQTAWILGPEIPALAVDAVELRTCGPLRLLSANNACDAMVELPISDCFITVHSIARTSPSVSNFEAMFSSHKVVPLARRIFST